MSDPFTETQDNSTTRLHVISGDGELVLSFITLRVYPNVDSQLVLSDGRMCYNGPWPKIIHILTPSGGVILLSGINKQYFIGINNLLLGMFVC